METYKVGDKCRYKGPDVKDSHGDVYLSKGTILVIRLIVPVHDSISIGRGFCYEVSLEWSRTVLGTTVWHTELEPIGGAARPGESVPVACRIKPAGGTPAEPVPVDPPAHDPVNRPPHYTMGGIEVIDAAEAWGWIRMLICSTR